MFRLGDPAELNLFDDSAPDDSSGLAYKRLPIVMLYGRYVRLSGYCLGPDAAPLLATPGGFRTVL
jgi:hypothetical protein